jgi:hypothetical protein
MEILAKITPLTVYYVHADLRSGQPVQGGQIQMYRTAMVQGPGTAEGLLDLYILESPRSNNPQFAGEKSDVPFVEEATLEDWSHGREFCCLKLNPPAKTARREFVTTIMQPPPAAPVRERMQEAHAERLQDPEPKPAAKPAAKPPKPAAKPQAKPAGKPAKNTDLAPMDFQIPEVAGVTRSRDKQTAT